ncbi:MAG: monovalent cation/H+ antiporter subunit D family protein [Deltaproteobacteria bacterium]|nr:monovalent cation/H+ antiporter subunit D family protein [Deltaproteobacteria bacterium]MBW2137053.1 monovalent cation/H+ antiporter subunit D family protein [Deltaproteobacteria bacterium]
MYLDHPVLVVIAPLIAGLLTPILGLLRKDLCTLWTILALCFSTLLSIDTTISVIDGGPIRYSLGGWVAPIGIEYVIDHLNSMMLVLVSSISLGIAIYSYRSVERELPGRETYFYTIYLLQVTGFLGIVITGDLFNLYVFLEIASLAGYALIAIGEDGAPYACFRYIVMGTIGACFYLLGIGYLYISTGSLNMADVHQLLQNLRGSTVITTAMAFITVGLAIKMALFPLHVWLPDAYTKAPSTSSALIAPLMTKISMYVMIRVLFGVFGASWSLALPLTTILSWAGVAAIFAGAIMALAQTDFKRMLCYVVVAEVGYIVGGMGLENPLAMKGAVLHILNDGVMTAGLFAIAGIVMYRREKHGIADFDGLFKEMPFTMAAFVVAALSIIGVPPTCGFFSKWYLVLGAIEARHWVFVAALIGSSLVNVILFFRVIEIGFVFRGPGAGHSPGGQEVGISEAPLSMLLPTLAIAAAIVIIGLFNQSIIANIINFAIPQL